MGPARLTAPQASPNRPRLPSDQMYPVDTGRRRARYTNTAASLLGGSPEPTAWCWAALCMACAGLRTAGGPVVRGSAVKPRPGPPRSSVVFFHHQRPLGALREDQEPGQVGGRRQACCGPEGWAQGRGWVTPVVSPSCPVLWSWVPVLRCGQALVLSLQAGAGVALLCSHSCGRPSLGGFCAGCGGGAGLAGLGWAGDGAPVALLAAGVSRRGALCGPSSLAGVQLGCLALLRQTL